MMLLGFNLIFIMLKLNHYFNTVIQIIIFILSILIMTDYFWWSYQFILAIPSDTILLFIIILKICWHNFDLKSKDQSYFSYYLIEIFHLWSSRILMIHPHWSSLILIQCHHWIIIILMTVICSTLLHSPFIREPIH